jgi:hypothetical protein
MSVAHPPGRPGDSARRELVRRQELREARIRRRLGPLGGAAPTLLRLVRVDEESGGDAAPSEEGVARRLEKHLRGRGVMLLHDRAVPRSKANIDAKNLKGRVKVVAKGGVLRPLSETLWIGGRNRTKLVEGVERQIETVRQQLPPAHADVPVLGALCMWNVDGLPAFGRLEIRDVRIAGPRGIGKLARRDGALTPDEVEALAAVLAERLPSR